MHNSELRDFEQREELNSNYSLLVKVFRIEPERRRIGLSVRRVHPKEWEDWVIAQAEAEEAERVQAEIVAGDEKVSESTTEDEKAIAEDETVESELETSVSEAEEVEHEAEIDISEKSVTSGNDTAISEVADDAEAFEDRTFSK